MKKSTIKLAIEIARRYNLPVHPTREWGIYLYLHGIFYGMLQQLREKCRNAWKMLASL